MTRNLTLQLAQDVSTLSGGLLLSATADAFILRDLQSDTVVQHLSITEFISEHCKYPSEILNRIKKDLDVNTDIVFYDTTVEKRIDALCESNRLLF